MHHVQSIPFLRILLPFIVGIITYRFQDALHPIFFLVLLLLSVILLIGFQYVSLAKKLKFSWFNGMMIQILLFNLGYLCVFVHRVENNSNWYRYHVTENTKLKGKLLTPLKETERTFKATVELTKAIDDKKSMAVDGEVILYFTKDAEKPILTTGDEIILINKLKPIINNGNPGGFDYAAFCQNKGIFDQCFLSTNEWKKVNQAQHNWLHPFRIWHEKIKLILRTYIPNRTSQGIAQALITGYRDDIEREIYTDYTKTGLIHLLAISGLHMGIFYMGTQFFLGLITFFRKRKRILIITALLTMWCFALVTTFPPSVQRASIMFTFLGIGQLIFRKIPTLNFLFASAFTLLIFQPHLLWDVGFQLSYTAVLGIILFYKPMNDRIYFKKFLLRKIWQLMCVSLSAQIFTFPIALYYFHQFPLLFLFTNVIAIPLVTIIIYGEVLLIVFSFFPPIAKMIGLLISFIISTLNSFIHFTAGLSFVRLHGIYINLFQCLLLLLFMLTLTAFFIGRRKQFLPISLALLLVVIGISIYHKKETLQQHQLVFYNANQPYLEHIQGNTSFLYDSIPSDKIEKFHQYVREPSHLIMGIQNGITDTPVFRNRFYDFITVAGRTILRVKKAYKLKTKQVVDIDYLVISDPWIKDILPLINNVRAKEIIIDGNIGLWKIEELKSQLSEVDLPTHYIATDGAKIIPL